jgi:serine/threonine protein kinase
MVDLTGRALGHYRMIELLGRGGMGEVYRAHDERLDRDVAIKVLAEEVSGDPERLSRFEREARASAALNHPNIATIYGLESDEEAGIHFLVMELIEGE